MQKNNIKQFVLVHKKEKAENITSLYFKTADGSEYNYVPGQYVSIKPQSLIGRGKYYTISSIPSEEFVCITIKRKGEVSSTILDSKIGDVLDFDGPYGHFYSEENLSEELVMIAGGISITPFFSILKERMRLKNKTKITLFYSNKTFKDIAFFDELNTLSKENPQFKVVYVLTQEEKENSQAQEHSRIDEKMLRKYIASLDNKNYYICGSVQFVKDLWKLLKDINIKEESIFTETFY